MRIINLLKMFNKLIMNMTTSMPDPTKGRILQCDNEEEPINLPNLDVMLDTILDILGVMSSEEMIKLRKTDFVMFERQMEKEFQHFHINIMVYLRKSYNVIKITILIICWKC